MSSTSFPPLYFVTDHHLTGGRPQLEVIRAALQGGIRFLQYRDKELSDADFAIEATPIVALAKSFGATVLFNDRVELAARLGADGVHLGQDDMPPLDARRILGPKAIIGLSTHNEPEVLASSTQPVTYINIGPVLPTATKDHSQYPALGLDEVLRLSRLTPFPWTTMGGIKSHHLTDFFRRGVQTVAMVTEISLAHDPAQRVQELLRLISGHGPA
jgi:thiamine-phosphate pyrophosphorylase